MSDEELKDCAKFGVRFATLADGCASGVFASRIDVHDEQPYAPLVRSLRVALVGAEVFSFVAVY
jgi:hypothetical protein